MIPAEMSARTSGTIQHPLRYPLRQLHHLVDNKDNPQAGDPSPTTKVRKSVLCPQPLNRSPTVPRMRDLIEDNRYPYLHGWAW